MVVVLSARHPTGHSLIHGHATVLATVALLLRDHACETVYLGLLICERRPAIRTVQATSEITFIQGVLFRNHSAL